MTRLRRLMGPIACSCLVGPAPATAGHHRVEPDLRIPIFAGGRPAGAAPLLDFAMVHAAIHDAVQAYEKRFQPYAVRHSRRVRLAGGSHCRGRARCSGKSVSAAGCNHSLEMLLFLTNHGLTEDDEGARRQPPRPRSSSGGMTEAIRRLPLRLTSVAWSRPVATNAAVVHGVSAPWLGAVEPFTMDFNEQFRARRPPALTSPRIRQGLQRGEGLGGPVGYWRGRLPTRPRSATSIRATPLPSLKA